MRRWGFVLAMLPSAFAAAPSAQAGEDPAVGATAAWAEPAAPLPAVETDLPLRRWDDLQAGTTTTALRTSPGAALTEGGGLRLHRVMYRQWFGLGDAHTAVGIGVGALNYQGIAGAGALPGSSDGPAGSTPIYSLSVQHQLSERTHVSFDVVSNQYLGSASTGSLLETRWNLEWRPTPDSGLGFARGAVHFRFDSGSVMSLRLRGGGAKLYYRMKF